MRYFSTRDQSAFASAADILMRGTAPDGGLYIPETLPLFSKQECEDFAKLTYTEAAAKIMAPFFEGLMPQDTLQGLINNAYSASQFSTTDVVPLKKIQPDFYLLELFHGPTCAFKDVALQLLGQLYQWRIQTTGLKPTIIGATSGDTGSAAIIGCQNSGAPIYILYPHGRTSDVQRKQMTTLDQQNIHALAIDGTFDDCQRIVKELFADNEFANNHHLTAVNSINWFRILAQTVYYFTSALKISNNNTPVHFSVPTGNFGNVLAGYIAKRMGAPIGQFVIGSNSNDILTRFFETGTMKASSVCATLAPSMDIQISSNFERYLFWLLGSSADVASKMKTFKETDAFSVSAEQLKQAQIDFKAYRCTDAQILETMREIHQTSNELIDPHTAIGVFAAQSAQLTGPIVSLACAHPAKFPDAVMTATGKTPTQPASLQAVMSKAEKIIRLPADTDAIRTYINRH